MNSDRWSKDQLKLAFNLYCQLPFGQIHSRNPEVIDLARMIGRTPSAVAMKLVNFASLDPAITGSGRKGLGNASALDREVWDEFHADWEKLAIECGQILERLRPAPAIAPETDVLDDFELEDYTAEMRMTIAERRVMQNFFRRAVMASYGERCCMSGLSDPRLLVASHIVPWKLDKANRLNPRNGLCLSALHDKAFDRGLITLTDDLRVIVSRQLQSLRDDSFLKEAIVALHDRPIKKPDRFQPDPLFLSRHRAEIFVG